MLHRESMLTPWRSELHFPAVDCSPLDRGLPSQPLAICCPRIVPVSPDSWAPSLLASVVILPSLTLSWTLGRSTEDYLEMQAETAFVPKGSD